MARLPLLVWDSTSGNFDEIVRWEAQEIAKHFHLKRGEHVGLVKTLGQETGGSAAAQSLTIRADVNRPSTTQSTFLNIDPTSGNHGRNAIGEMMWLRGDASDTYLAQDVPFEMIEVFESITFQKVAAATWNFILDYAILEGNMRWPTEDAFKDMFSVEPERSAGGPYFQPGRLAGEPFHKVYRTHV